MKKTVSGRLLGAGAASFAMGVALLSGPAAAQDIANDGAVEGDTIVVTGSRIARHDVDAPVPVSVVSSTDLQYDAAQNIQDTLNEMPQVAIGLTRANSNFLISGTGVATIDLRGLGDSRTLVLVNGRRFVGGLPGDSAVDVNNIPTDFIERVEIVTGGSSAVYGSDAVAGVVNFILKDQFEGVSVRGQAGLTGRGDNARYMTSVTAGTSFGSDDRGNILTNFTYDRDAGLFSNKRARSAQDCAGLICGPASYSSYASQGRFQLVDADGLANNAYQSGSLFTFDRDNNVVTGFPAEAGYNRNDDRYISVPVERYLASAIANFDITDSAKLFGELTYGRVRSNSRLEPFAMDWTDVYTGADDLGMSIDNPFIPAEVAAAIAARNSDADPDNDVAAIQFRRRQNDVFDRSNVVRRDTWRAVAGIRGDLGSKLKYEASYVYGNMNDYNASEDIDNRRYRNALNAARVGPGNVLGVDIVCADAAARAEGCIPINLFGYDTADPRAAAYVQAVIPKSQEITNQQHVATATISGTPFDLGAGDVGFALGFEYRKEKSVSDWDTLTNTGGNSGNQTPDLVGSYTVKEIFGELNVPLIRDSFVDYFGLIAAARLSDYSTVGSVLSWNAGAEIQPFEGLRLRGVYAEANRAPNTSELFSQPSETFAAVTDPCNGVTASTSNEYAAACRAIPAIQAAIAANGVFEYTLADLQGINGFLGGNLNLQEEKARTFTIGAVITPVQVRNLSLTIDYYDIAIDRAINTIGRTYSIQQCLLTDLPLYCDNVVRNANTGRVTRVDGQLINVAGYKNSGIDVGLRYWTGLGIAPDDRLSITANYTYLIENSTQADPVAPVEDAAGTFGQAFSRHRFTGRAAYSVDDITFSWQTKFMSGGDYVLNFTSTDPDILALNKIGDYWLHDLQVRYDVDQKYSFYFGIDNVFDTQPPYLPGTPFGTPTGLETGDAFDLFGRAFTVGASFRF